MEAEIIQLVQTTPIYAYLAVFGVLLACGLGVPMPEDITLVAGGYTVYLAQQHGLSQPAVIPMIAVGMLGVLTGDTILFLTGRYLGPKVTRVWPFRLMINDARMEKVHAYFKKYGVWTAFFARFAAGLRAPTYLLAGTARMGLRTFVLADGSAAMISVPLLVWLAWRFGAQIDRVKGWIASSKYLVGAVFLLLAIYVVYRVLKARKLKRQRREAPEASDSQASDSQASDSQASDSKPPGPPSLDGEQV